MSTNENNTYVINPNQEITYIQAESRHGFACGSPIPPQVMTEAFNLGLFFDTFDRERAVELYESTLRIYHLLGPFKMMEWLSHENGLTDHIVKQSTSLMISPDDVTFIRELLQPVYNKTMGEDFAQIVWDIEQARREIPSTNFVPMSPPLSWNHPPHMAMTDPIGFYYRGNPLAIKNQPIFIGSCVATSRNMDEFACELAHTLIDAGENLITNMTMGSSVNVIKAANERGVGVMMVNPHSPNFYPISHIAPHYEENLSYGGVMLSLNPPGHSMTHADTTAHHRFISSKAKAVVAVSGTMRNAIINTVSIPRLNYPESRPVIACLDVCSQAHSVYFEGSKALINAGAKTARSVDDVMREIQLINNQ